MSKSNETWRDKKSNTTYTIHSPDKVEVHNPNKGTSWINKPTFNRIKNGK